MTKMRPMKKLLTLLVLYTACAVFAQDEETTLPYFQSSAFNVPRQEYWEDQSGVDYAQFRWPVASATVRVAMVPEDDFLTAVRLDLREVVGTSLAEPIYDGKVNLADGTWRSLVFEPDDVTTVSVMARRAGSQTAVISYIEEDPASRFIMLTVAQGGEARDDATSDIASAVEHFTDFSLERMEYVGRAPVGPREWQVYLSEDLSAMGWAFGNDSLLVLVEGPNRHLFHHAIAYSGTLLGFFITPDNSAYLALALAAVFVILGGLLFSFYWRWRNLRQDLAMLNELSQEET